MHFQVFKDCYLFTLIDLALMIVQKREINEAIYVFYNLCNWFFCFLIKIDYFLNLKTTTNKCFTKWINLVVDRGKFAG